MDPYRGLSDLICDHADPLTHRPIRAPTIEILAGAANASRISDLMVEDEPDSKVIRPVPNIVGNLTDPQRLSRGPALSSNSPNVGEVIVARPPVAS